MTFHDAEHYTQHELEPDPDDPANYLPKRDGGAGIGLFAGILFGLPFGFMGATVGALVGSLVGAFVDQERHARDIERERERIGWVNRGIW